MSTLSSTQTNPNNMYINVWKTNQAVANKTPKGTSMIFEQDVVFGTIEDAIKQYFQEEHKYFDYQHTIEISNDKVTCKFIDIKEIIQERAHEKYIAEAYPSDLQY